MTLFPCPKVVSVSGEVCSVALSNIALYREVVEQLDERLGEPRVRRGDDLVAEGEGHAVVHARPLAVPRLQEVLPGQLLEVQSGCDKIKIKVFQKMYHSSWICKNFDFCQ